MKHQYFGDVNDYRKYALLRTLSDGGRLKAAVCWMLTPSDSRTDGRRTEYLERPDLWRPFDPSLFDHLLDCVKRGCRDIGTVERSGILRRAIFHSPILPDQRDARMRYFVEFGKKIADVDLVFFDPDNGLEVKSVRYGGKNSSKYLYWNELTEVCGKGCSVLLYQHFPRVRRENFISDVTREISLRLRVPEVISFHTAFVLFLLIPDHRNRTFLSQQSRKVAATWGDQINVTFHSLS